MDEPMILNKSDATGKTMEFTGGNISEVVATMMKVAIVPIRFGDGAKLFKKHISFKGSQHELPPPVMGAAKQLSQLAVINTQQLQGLLRSVLPPLIGGILELNFSENRVANDHDQPYMESLIRMFVSLPVHSYKEIHLEYNTKKKLIGGSLDIMVGSTSNGNRPQIYLDSKSLSL